MSETKKMDMPVSPAKNDGKREMEKLLIVDDDALNRALLVRIFGDEYDPLQASDGKEGLKLIEAYGRDLSAILLDVVMPGIDGIQVLRTLYGQGFTREVPVFLITADTAGSTIREAYDLGVMDVIRKPVVPYLVRRRVDSVVELFRARRQLGAQVQRQQSQLLLQAQRLAEMSMGIVESLATAIEFRSDESGEHVCRIRDTTCYLLQNTSLGSGLSCEQIKLIGMGAVTHDVGKLAIPDAVLNKKGRLTPEEFELMKTHAAKGAQLLSNIPQMREHSAYAYAYDIALHHHERWDGRGYPDGLVGDQTPIWTQVVALADVYDALVSKRCYKDAYSPSQAMDMILQGQCGAFNPKLLDCFRREEPALRKLYYHPEGA